MNPLFQAAKENLPAEAGVLMGLMTVAFMALFAAWTWWAYAPSRAARMESFGNLPFDEEEAS